MRRVVYERNLRGREHVANQDYTCDYCFTPIFAGDYYSAEIKALRILISDGTKIRKVKTIDTRRRHIHPMCPGPDLLDEDFEKDERALSETDSVLESSMVA